MVRRPTFLTVLRALSALRRPLAALAIVALLGHQAVGAAIAAAPPDGMSVGGVQFSICVAISPFSDGDSDQFSHCPCLLHNGKALATPAMASGLAPEFVADGQRFAVPDDRGPLFGAPAPPPPSRAPPIILV